MYDNIVGIEGRSIDNKYRIILPKYIGVCEDEKLVLIYKDKDFNPETDIIGVEK